MSGSTTSAEFFEKKYRTDADPWDFATSEYEQGRYDATVRALNGVCFERAFEPGCAVGELTWRLAQICGQVEAMDISATAVSRASERCADLPNVHLCVGGLPHGMPDGDFDLIMFSEIGYYFEEASLRELGSMLVSRIRPSGTLLAAHWLGTSEDHILSGDRVHEILRSLSGLSLQHSERHEGFRLDRWMRVVE